LRVPRFRLREARLDGLLRGQRGGESLAALDCRDELAVARELRLDLACVDHGRSPVSELETVDPSAAWGEGERGHFLDPLSSLVGKELRQRGELADSDDVSLGRLEQPLRSFAHATALDATT